MSERALAQRLCRFYVQRVALVGAAYCAVPTVIYFLGMFAALPFRPVYVLRLILALLLGVPAATLVNRFAVSLWLLKHRSTLGPATVRDGFLLGGAAGYGSALLPALTALIGTRHPEQAMAFILWTWSGAALLGASWGSALAAFGRKHLPTIPEPWEQP